MSSSQKYNVVNNNLINYNEGDDVSKFEQKILKDRGVVLVEFFATWCSHCNAFAPLIAELSKELEVEQVKVCKVDIDEYSNISKHYNISSTPTLILFENGKKLDSKIGKQFKPSLKQWIEKNRKQQA